MKKKFSQEVEIPEGVEVIIEKNTFIVKGKEGENKRSFSNGGIKFRKVENKIIIEHEKATKREKKKINTMSAHLKNMIKGVQEKFEYNLKICASHFPITVDIKDNFAEIKNFLGEKTPRKVSIPKGIEVNADKQNITIKSINKELAGQGAANFERATKVRGRDRRVFQDGIFLVNKAGKEI